MGDEGHIYDIRLRSKAFAVTIITLVRSFPKDTASYVIGKQVIRSSTSISANIAEAQGALTKKEFIHSMNIAKKEALECANWIEMIQESHLHTNTDHLLKECNEIIKIFVSIVKRSQQSASL